MNYFNIAVLVFKNKQYMLFNNNKIIFNFNIINNYIFINKLLLLINKEFILLGTPLIKGILFFLVSKNISLFKHNTIKFKRRKRYLKIINYVNYNKCFFLKKVFLITNGKKKISRFS